MSDTNPDAWTGPRVARWLKMADGSAPIDWVAARVVANTFQGHLKDGEVVLDGEILVVSAYR